MRSKMEEAKRHKLVLSGVKCPEALDNTCGIWKAGSCSWSKRCKTPCKTFTLTQPAGKRKNKTKKDTIWNGPQAPEMKPTAKEPPFQAQSLPEMIASITTINGTGTVSKTPQGKLRITIELEDKPQNRVWLSNKLWTIINTKVS